jgi:lauroyl/myristoyl acyltransferase
MNLTAIPLLIGLGVDFSIHIQLALRRHRGDALAVHRNVGRALLLAGSTTIAGFASLAFSSNAGLASLGRICATGIAVAMLTSVYLLPAWWRTFGQVEAAASSRPLRAPREAGAPGVYRAWIWRLGLGVARRLPPGLGAFLGRTIGLGFWLLASARRRTVVANLLPVVGGDRARAERLGRSLFANFGLKIADLWRYESGRSVDGWFTELLGTEHFSAAVARRRGLLLVTPHLGNWEFGAPLMARRGVQVLAITQAEPDPGLTKLRVEARSRWGIETLVIQEDPFAFVEVIRRLEGGAAVALLVDRPHPATAVNLELFGRPFAASLAPAELARATGCVVLPVCVLRHAHGYSAHVLPEVPYDRAGLRQVEARLRFTQEILRAFEPMIRQHADQWYHFVPIWAATDPPGGSSVPGRAGDRR